MIALRSLVGTALIVSATVRVDAAPLAPPALEKFLDAARAQTGQAVRYDGSYRKLAYPGGDVPSNIGVCTDVVIRAYRAIGIDLQVKVHEDMKRAFAAYPKTWGRSAPDPNIDHRRVPNLQAFFKRAGAGVAISREAKDYHPGDLVTWMLPGSLPHIGIVAGERSVDGVPLIIHNIGRGPQIEDSLFAYTITGHYRYGGE
jgi:uncharacterized protein YijF (DUF1287 family)